MTPLLGRVLLVRKTGEGPNTFCHYFIVSPNVFASTVIAEHAELYDAVKGHFHPCPLLIQCTEQAPIGFVTVPRFFFLS